MKDLPFTPESKPLRVECAAILWTDRDRKVGHIYSVQRPGRHHDVIRVMAEAGLPTPITGEQGFLLNDGRFVRRKAALRIARQAEQLIREPTAPAHGLFSEDVW